MRTVQVSSRCMSGRCGGGSKQTARRFSNSATKLDSRWRSNYCATRGSRRQKSRRSWAIRTQAHFLALSARWQGCLPETGGVAGRARIILVDSDWRGRRDCGPAPLLGRPVGAVAESHLCRDAATSNLAHARLSNADDVGGSQTLSGTKEMKRSPSCEEPFSISLARPEGFEPPTLRFEA